MMIRNVIVLISLLATGLFDGPVGLSAELAVSSAVPSKGGQINGQVISSIGTRCSSTNFQLRGTVGQTIVGHNNSTNFGSSRFSWKTDYTAGDADGSGGVDIDDVVYLITYIFSGGPAPDPLAAGDADCAGGIDIDDVVYLISYIFTGGNAPCDPNGDAAQDC